MRITKRQLRALIREVVENESLQEVTHVTDPYVPRLLLQQGIRLHSDAVAFQRTLRELRSKDYKVVSINRTVNQLVEELLDFPTTLSRLGLDPDELYVGVEGEDEY